MNRRNPTWSGNLGNSAVEKPRSPGWGPGEHRGQGAERYCPAPNLRRDLYLSDYPAARCHTRPCPGCFYTGTVEHATAQECTHSFSVDFSSPC